MSSRATREIGSEFEVSEECCSPESPLFQEDAIWLSTGRDAFHLAIQALGLNKGNEVLLPSYLCNDVITPFRDHGIQTSFYRVDDQLAADTGDILSRWNERTRAVVLIHYFGFDQSGAVARIQDVHPEAAVIEDCSHSFLSRPRHAVEGCLRIASVRKMLPIPDGAFLHWRDPDGRDLGGMMVGSTVKQIRVSIRVAAARLKKLWLGGWPVPKPLFRWMFSIGESLIARQAKPAAMSTYSHRIVHLQNVDEIVSRRRRNFSYLLTRMSGLKGVRPLYDRLESGVCPLGFPIVADRRDALRSHLIRERIYPPIHWELPADVDEETYSEAAKLSRSTMTLPIDQRYSVTDMKRVSDAVDSFLSVTD